MNENVYATQNVIASFKVPYNTEVKVQTRHYPYEAWVLNIPDDITTLETANLCKFTMWIMGAREPEHFSMFGKRT